MKQEDLRSFLQEDVVITVKSGAKYSGLLNGIRGDKIHLTKLGIHNKAGAITHSKKDTGRWFRSSSVKVITLKSWALSEQSK